MKIERIVGGRNDLLLFQDGAQDIHLEGYEARQFLDELSNTLDSFMERLSRRNRLMVCPQCHGNGYVIDDDGQQGNCDVCDAQGEV